MKRTSMLCAAVLVLAFAAVGPPALATEGVTSATAEKGYRATTHLVYIEYGPKEPVLLKADEGATEKVRGPTKTAGLSKYGLVREKPVGIPKGDGISAKAIAAGSGDITAYLDIGDGMKISIGNYGEKTTAGMALGLRDKIPVPPV